MAIKKRNMAIKKRNPSKVVIAPQPGKQELAFNTKVDIMIYGGSAGSGKSRLLLMKPLLYKDDPNFTAVFFRKTIKALERPGSLWPEAKKLYRPFKSIVRERDHSFTFKRGAKVLMDYMEYDSHAVDNHQGTQYSMVGFDELTHFTAYQFNYLIGRLRSEAEGDSFLMATCNPDPDSWVLDWVIWYLYPEGTLIKDPNTGEEINVGGRPDPAKCGVVRYFVIEDEKPIFADTTEELEEKYPNLCWVRDENTGELRHTPPKSFTFIGGTIFDNPALIRSNPSYLSSLQAQTKINRERLLYGNWFARPEGSENFHRNWLQKVANDPGDCVWVRAWDKASSVPSDVNPYPDYTASIKMGKSRSTGNVYIRGDFCEENKDKYSKGDDALVYGKVRLRPGERDQLILQQSVYDGKDTLVVLPRDPGSAGKTEYEESAKKLLYHEDGPRRVLADPIANNQSKLVKYTPFSSACQNGFVCIVESSFPNRETLEAFYKENEAFNGERSTSKRKDDWPDAAATAYNTVSKTKVVPIIARNQMNNDTLSKDYLSSLENLRPGAADE